jgi:hypothetical protein
MTRRSQALGLALAAVLAAGVWWAARTRSPRSGCPRCNLVVVLIDTLRQDHVGAYGYPRATTPNIDGLARTGIRFGAAHTVASWTNPAIFALMTGLYPRHYLSLAPGRDLFRLGIPAAAETLDEPLKQAGYRTALLSDHPTILPSLGYGQAIDHFEPAFRSWEGQEAAYAGSELRHLVDLTDGLLARLGEGESGAPPFYLYVHIIYPHAPYNPRRQQLELFRDPLPPQAAQAKDPEALDDYDRDVWKADRYVGRLVRLLEDRRLRDRTMIVVTADHGEGFGEYGSVDKHGSELTEHLLRVPLVIWLPGRAQRPRVVEEPISLVDVKATLLELLSIRTAAPMDGISLVPALRGQPLPARTLFAGFGMTGNRMLPPLVAMGQGHKLFWEARDRAVSRLVRLDEIGREDRDSTNAPRELRARLEDAIRLFASAAPRVRDDAGPSSAQAGDAALTPEAREQLKALGYIQDGTEPAARPTGRLPPH